MRRFVIAACAMVLSASNSSAQKGRGNAAPRATASISGDFYLMAQSGDIRRGAGQHVYLQAYSDTLRRAYNLVCSTYRTALERQHRVADSAQGAATYAGGSLSGFTSAVDSVVRIKNNFARIVHVFQIGTRTTNAGMDAHFEFDSLPPGRFLLTAEWQIGDDTFRWFVPVQVRAGGRVKQDLNGDNAEDETCSSDLPPLG